MITCIILSAGLSRRFGSPKALAKIGNGPVIVKIQNNLLLTQVAEIIVVLGGHAASIKPFILNHKSISVVYNKDYNLGQTSSFQAGLKQASPSAQGIMLLPVDYPFIKKETFDVMCGVFNGTDKKILIPSFNNVKGHPPIFDASLRQEILALDTATGLNIFEQKHPREVSLVPVEDKGILQTFNTPEELAQLSAE